MQAAHGALALTILGVAIGLLGWWQQPQVTVADAPAMLPSLPVAANVSSAAVTPVAPDYSRSEERRVGKEGRSGRRRHTRFSRDWSSDVCSSDLRQVCKRCRRRMVHWR